MTSVKDDSVGEPHVLQLLDPVLQHFRDLVAGEDWRGLRASHFRMMSAVPARGITITELADRLGMTKQGCGQFATGMVELGLLSSAADPADGRARVVSLTPAGHRTIRRFEQRVAEVERDWAAAVGPRRYATFRAVLAELPKVGG